MARRVVLNENGLKVSAAGQNADTALPYQLLFDSNFCYPGLIMRGSIFLDRNDFGGPDQDVLYGRTFPTPPILIVGVFNNYVVGSNSFPGVNWTSDFSGQIFFSQVFKPNGTLFTTRAYGRVLVNAMNDRFRMTFYRFEDGFQVRSTTLHYAVFSYTL